MRIIIAEGRKLGGIRKGDVAADHMHGRQPGRKAGNARKPKQGPVRTAVGIGQEDEGSPGIPAGPPAPAATLQTQWEDFLHYVRIGNIKAAESFAKAILDASGEDCRLLPVPSSEYRSPARRPAYSVLDNTKLRETFGLALPDWRYSLDQCLEDLQ